MRTVFYPGSFDPITLGHVDIIARAGRMFDRVCVGIGFHGGKQPLFDVATRLELVQAVMQPLVASGTAQFEAIAYDDLTVAAARRVGACAILRGLRDATDFDYEVQFAHMNALQDEDIETVFLVASPQTRMISSSLVKQIAKLGGDISQFVPEEVRQAMVKCC